MSVDGSGRRVLRVNAEGDTITGPMVLKKVTWDPGTAVPMVVRLTITHECTEDGNVTITLPGLAAVDIAVTTTEDTAAKVATAIQAGTFTGWTAAIIDDDDDNKVTFTQNTALARDETPVVAFASTGVTGTIAVATAAVNGPIAATNRLLVLDGSSPILDYTAVAGGLTLDRDFPGGLRIEGTLTFSAMDNGHCMVYIE